MKTERARSGAVNKRRMIMNNERVLLTAVP